LSAYSKEACLAWLAGAGISNAEIRILLSVEPNPVRLYDECVRFESDERDARISVRVMKALQKSTGPERFDETIEKHHIQAMTEADDEYPERLRGITDAPAILFYQGRPEAIGERTVSVVGSRNASGKGMEAASGISRELSKNGVNIISGLAYGIDAASHRGCLQGGSETVAVLGCGLDIDYPAENSGLKKEILEKGGLVVSEYAPGVKPLGWHFPYRNRIISGIGDCVAVIEARLKSGSMTTVQHALSQGKDVFVYPGDPGSIRSEGNHQLLREGAIYFTGAQDLMEDMRWLDNTADMRQNNERAGWNAADFSSGEFRVLMALADEEKSFEELCFSLKMSAGELNAALSMLQIRGVVRALPGKKYETVH